MFLNVLEKQVIPVLGLNLQKIIKKCSPPLLEKVQEIRLREGRPLMFCLARGDLMVDPRGEETNRREKAYLVNRQDMQNTLQSLSSYSLYAFEEELKNGYLTIPGGHRVGLAGKAVLNGGTIKLQKYITGINIRISREVLGAGEKVLKYLIREGEPRVYSTLVISPPQCGKTTLLRDLARLLSDGVERRDVSFRGVKIGVVDERSEIAGSFEGLPQNSIGLRTDVIDACPKSQGMMLMIRSMSPQVLVTDEIGSMEDALAIEEALKCGVAVIAAAHGSSRNEIRERPGLKRLMDQKVFKRLIILSNSRGVGTLEEVWDEGASHGGGKPRGRFV
ncbi:MAG: stage III sporulation protein AA [Candidatus Syntrophonatronum acetioxidans]|uniref:Stage III sporulation protein AA n=1 Tax=Candidatus Syntrophonatronum acetioxidans TaxID=1795816 RepID=A0A424YFB3_9FIRM|nr:MAG: stage III sporulation protein AA [Candidatus Syntrophonatronum acetioxidans]